MGILEDSGLRFAIFGLCHWHAEYYRDILKADRVALVGATDRDQASGLEKAARWTLPFETSLDDLVARHHPDFLFVLPRHDQACEDIAAAARTGLPLLIEKPFGLNGHEARRAATAVEATGVFADACLPNRHMDIWSAAREHDAFGAGSELQYAHFRTNNGPARRYMDYGVPWMLHGTASGGGALRNLGYHGADAALSVAGKAGLTVCSAQIKNLAGTSIENFGAATMRCESGAIITLEAGYATASDTGIDHEWRISTDRVFLCQHNGVLTVQTREDDRPRTVTEHNHRTFYQRLVNESVGALMDDRPPNVRIGEAVRAAGLIDEIYLRAAAEESVSNL